MRSWLVALLAVMLLSARAAPGQATPQSRSYRMGFSLVGPRFDVPTFLKTIEEWSRHGDAAIQQQDVPWRVLLSGGDAETWVNANVVPLMNRYRSHGFMVVCTLDLGNGIDRTQEAKELVEMKRSIAEPEVQKAFVDFAAAYAKIVKPEYLGLGSELNLLRDHLPDKTNDAMVAMCAEAAKRVKQVSPETILYVSVQAEWAWGRLGGVGGDYKGCEEIFKDFPFIQALGVSSYPAFGWGDPKQLPIDYFRRLLGGRSLPVLMVEGGWPSTDVPGAKSDQDKEARWLKRLFAILDDCHASFVGLLMYTDLDLPHIPELKGTIMPMFATMGLVDIDYKPKPAMAIWDEAFRRPWVRVKD
ncbi:MAG TPA: hypothetical protein VMI31_10245 [Fimbriimonadaceae bacterium]|nr:hypothetical protein [Fimbriimonadaceae bacterium]